MSLQYPQNPRCGTVSSLCRDLGYDSTNIKERSREVLSKQTGEYRKRIVADSNELIEFPMDDTIPLVRDYAISFLENHQHLFLSSTESFRWGWPTYPEDREKIVDLLAKLFVTQEFNYRFANCQREVKKSKDLIQTTHQHSQRSTDIYDIETTPEMMANDSCIHIQSSRQVQRLQPDQGSENSFSDEISDDEAMNQRIEHHLDCIFPFDDPTNILSTDWIFYPIPCPDSLLPFVSRHMHENNTYNSRKQNYDAIRKLSTALRLYLQLDETSPEEYIMFSKCEKLVRRLATKWKMDHFLVGKNGNMEKHPRFRVAWENRRDAWIQANQAGIAGKTIEVVDAEVSSDRHNATSKKRSAETVGYSQSPPKRIAEFASFEMGFALEQTIERDVASEEHESTPLVISPYKFAPEAVMYEGQTAISKINNMQHQVNRQNVGRPLDQQRSTSASHLPPNPENENVSAIILLGRHSNEPITIDSSPSSSHYEVLPGENVGPAHHQSGPNSTGPRDVLSPIKLPTTSSDRGDHIAQQTKLNEPTKNPEQLARIPRSKQPVKQKVKFLAENQTNTLDAIPEDVFSEKIFEEFTLDDLFQMMSERACKSLSELTCLTLRYYWEGMQPVVITNDMDEDSWEDMKDTLLEYIAGSKREMPKKRIFQIAIKCGDTRDLGTGRR